MQISQSNNFSERQSFYLNDIKDHIRNGGNITHMLEIRILREPSIEIGTRILEEIHELMGNQPIEKIVNGFVNVTITWRNSGNRSSPYYHTDVAGMFGDIAVKLHTQLLLLDIMASIDKKFNQIFSTGKAGVQYSITKPLVQQIADFVFDEINLRAVAS